MSLTDAPDDDRGDDGDEQPEATHATKHNRRGRPCGSLCGRGSGIKDVFGEHARRVGVGFRVDPRPDPRRAASSGSSIRPGRRVSTVLSALPDVKESTMRHAGFVSELFLLRSERRNGRHEFATTSLATMRRPPCRARAGPAVELLGLEMTASVFYTCGLLPSVGTVTWSRVRSWLDTRVQASVMAWS